MSASPFIVTTRRKVHLRACPHAYRIALPSSWLPEVGRPEDHACITCLSGLLPTAVPSEEGPMSADGFDLHPEGCACSVHADHDTAPGQAAAWDEFVQRIATHHAYNGADDPGQEFYDRGLNAWLASLPNPYGGQR